MRLDIDGAIQTSKASTAEQALTNVQSENSIMSSNMSSTQNKNLLTFNWVVEKWVPTDLKCYGEVYSNGSKDQGKKKQNTIKEKEKKYENDTNF